MTDDLRCNLRLSDVHATAETVGREFKQLTDKFGMKCVMGLVPPVVEALERLEVYVESHQHLQTRLSELLMDNDTLAYEREQKAKLAEEKEVLTAKMRELQRENKFLLMEMDELYFRNEELSAQLRNYQQTGRAELESVTGIEDPLLETTPPIPLPSHPPHSPHRVVHLSQNYSSPPHCHSPNFTPSPSPTVSIPNSPSATLALNDFTHTPPSPSTHNHTSHTQPSHNHTPHPPPNFTSHIPPLSHNHTPHTPPHTFQHNPHTTTHHHNPYQYSNTPPARRSRGQSALQTVCRSSSLSDIVGVRVQPSSPATINQQQQQEDMCERSRVTRRLTMVEEELEKLRDSQRSREKLVKENKELRTQLERVKAEAALKKFDLSKRELQKVNERPRYYKEEMMRVLTERNQLKETLLSRQEELDELREALRKATAANGVVEVPRNRVGGSVRSILTESISLQNYNIPSSPPSHTPKLISLCMKHVHNK